MEINSKDEFKDFLTKIKELLSELGAFIEIKNDIKENSTMTQEMRKKQTEINGELSKIRSMDKDTIKVGLFKTKNKKDLLQELQTQLDEVNQRFNPTDHRELGRIAAHEIDHLPPAKLPRVPKTG